MGNLTPYSPPTQGRRAQRGVDAANRRVKGTPDIEEELTELTGGKKNGQKMQHRGNDEGFVVARYKKEDREDEDRGATKPEATGLDRETLT